MDILIRERCGACSWKGARGKKECDDCDGTGYIEEYLPVHEFFRLLAEQIKAKDRP